MPAARPPTEIVMVGHASALIRHGDFGLLTDPWFGGRIFNESWELLSPSFEAAAAEATYIWISHEHPDHLHFPTLRRLAAGPAKACRLLFQWHPRRDVAKALASLGFAGVEELPPARWRRLAPDVDLLCMPSRRIDSLVALRTPGATILNLNDCKIGAFHARQIARAVGPVDVMMAQFSIANWQGNAYSEPLPQRREKVARRSAALARIFRPGLIVPFGSFVRFCHADNAHLNRWTLSPREAVALLSDSCDSPTLLLYPSDRWSSAGPVQPTGAAERYERDMAEARKPAGSPSVPPAELVAAGQTLNERLRRAFPLPVRALIEPVELYLDDHRQAIRFDVARGRTELTGLDREACHIALHSQALCYAFESRWGFDTLDISGRYEVARGPRRPGAFRLCDAYSSGWGERNLWTRRNLWHLVGRFWAKRGELLDRIARRLRATGGGRR